MKNIQSKLLNDNFDYFIGNRFNFLIRTVAFFICKKFERNDFKCILPTSPNSGSLKERCVRNLILTDAMMITMKARLLISLITRISIQTEKKTEVDFMTIKIRSPTKAIT